MNATALRVLYVLIVVALFSVLNGSVYTYVLPTFFPGPGYGTYLPLIAGVLISALIGGWIGYRIPTKASSLVKGGVGFGFAMLVTILVFNLSMLIIVNTRGE